MQTGRLRAWLRSTAAAEAWFEEERTGYEKTRAVFERECAAFFCRPKGKANNNKRKEEVAAADVLGLTALHRGGGGGWRFVEKKCAITDPNSGATPGFYFM